MAGKPTEVIVLLEHTPLHEVVEVAESPGNEPESSDAEQSIQNLTVNLNPDLASTRVVIAGGMAHCGSSVEEDEEDHGTPTYHIETVDGDKKAKRCQKELPECFKTDGGGLPPGMLGRKSVPVGVRARLVWRD